MRARAASKVFVPIVPWLRVPSSLFVLELLKFTRRIKTDFGGRGRKGVGSLCSPECACLTFVSCGLSGTPSPPPPTPPPSPRPYLLDLEPSPLKERAEASLTLCAPRGALRRPSRPRGPGARAAGAHSHAGTRTPRRGGERAPGASPGEPGDPPAIARGLNAGLEMPTNSKQLPGSAPACPLKYADLLLICFIFTN